MFYEVTIQSLLDGEEEKSITVNVTFDDAISIMRIFSKDYSVSICEAPWVTIENNGVR